MTALRFPPPVESDDETQRGNRNDAAGARSATARLVELNQKRKFKSWARELWHWAGVRPRLVWLGFLYPLFAFSAIWSASVAAPTWLEATTRIGGLALQLLGVVTAIRGILGIRQQFGLPKVRDNLLQWWRERPRFRLKPVSGGLEVSVGGATVDMRGHAELRVVMTGTLEQRIETLEKHVQTLAPWIGRIQGELAESKRTFTHLFEQEAAAFRDDLTRLKEFHKTTSTDGLGLAAIGAVWAAIGSLLSAIFDILRALHVT